MQPSEEYQDLIAVIKQGEELPRLLRMVKCHMEIGEFAIFAYVDRLSLPSGPSHCVELRFLNVYDYAIRPPNPNLIEGVLPFDVHKDHKLLPPKHNQWIPGGDGEIYDPPLDLKVFEWDQSYVIAETFLVRPWNR